MARPVDQILSEARSELIDREQRLTETRDRVQSELNECKAAIKRLGGKATKGQAKRERSNGGAPSEVGNKIVAALKGSLEPMTASQIAEQVDNTPAGVGASLRRLEVDGQVVRVDTVNDKHRWGVSQLNEGIKADEIAVAMSPDHVPA